MTRKTTKKRQVLGWIRTKTAHLLNKEIQKKMLENRFIPYIPSPLKKSPLKKNQREEEQITYHSLNDILRR